LKRKNGRGERKEKKVNIIDRTKLEEQKTKLIEGR